MKPLEHNLELPYHTEGNIPIEDDVYIKYVIGIR